jgi:hypothetical protein
MAKKKKDFTGDPGGLIGDAIFSTIKPIYKEGEKQRRQRVPRRSRRTYFAPIPKTTQKDMFSRFFHGLSRTPGSTSALATSTTPPGRSPTPIRNGRTARS